MIAMQDSEKCSSNFTLLYLLMIYVGLYMFLFGLVKSRATRGSTLFLAWISTVLILIGGTMLLFDRSSKPKSTTYSDSVVVTVAKANVRSTPSASKKNNIVGKVGRQTELSHYGKAKGWYVVDHGESTAYIHASTVQKRYKIRPGSFRWPGLGTTMIFFVGIYLFSLIRAVREDRAFWRSEI